MRSRVFFPILLCLPWFSLGASSPNVLFISLDDLNDWVGCLGGHPQAKTPHLDALAESGVLFTNAHCPAPACNPSRSAIMTGVLPTNSGLIRNEQKMREMMPDEILMPRHFSDHGYWSAGSGKILHYFIDAESWDDYYPEAAKENPFPPHMPWGERPKSLPRAEGKWQYGETDWHAFDVSDEEFGGDYKVAEWVGAQLRREHDKPFFLACGFYRPHEPWFAPKRYFDLHPLEQVQMPPGLKDDDLEDLPPEAQRIGPNRYLAHIREHGQWKRGVQAYLASISFADAMLGRVIAALDEGPNTEDTIVVLWSDHGWHLGEKQHWQKFTGWRACTRVPLIIRAPGVTEAGGRCDEAVGLINLFATLTDLAGIPAKENIDGLSLRPLLENPKAKWSSAPVTQLARIGDYALSLGNWRYIHYAGGGEELYDIEADPYEWENLADDPEHLERIEKMRSLSQLPGSGNRE